MPLVQRLRTRHGGIILRIAQRRLKIFPGPDTEEAGFPSAPKHNPLPFTRLCLFSQEVL